MREPDDLMPAIMAYSAVIILTIVFVMTIYNHFDNSKSTSGIAIATILDKETEIIKSDGATTKKYYFSIQYPSEVSRVEVAEQDYKTFRVDNRIILDIKIGGLSKKTTVQSIHLFNKAEKD